jgi:hypothetical protein
MGKKTKSEKVSLDVNLDRQCNLAQFLAERNPWFKNYDKQFPNRFALGSWGRMKGEDYTNVYKEYDKKFAEIWGDIIPTFPYPVLKADEFFHYPDELILKINLQFTEDEIMFRVKQFVESELKKRHKIRKIVQRKIPVKWLDCLEIWDLKSGFQPWIKDSFGPFLPLYRKSGRPWTYEEIAKFKYPDERSPEELAKAMNRVKKQYRAAFKLVCGKKYKPIKDIFKEHRPKKLCDKCPDRPNCNDYCPPLIKELASIEVKQQHKIVDNPNSLDMKSTEEEAN